MSSSTKYSGSKDVKVEIMRTPLGRARGLGAAGAGVHHWWMQRLTSFALIPLTFWFIYVVCHLSGLPRADVARFLGHPLNTTLMLALIVGTFHHMQAGLQVVIEDYLHAEPYRVISLVANQAVSVLLGAACAMAVLKLAFTG